MAIVYLEQQDGSYTAFEDDVLIVLRPLRGAAFAYEVWLGDEKPAYEGEATGGVNDAKARVQAWLDEALADED